MQINVRIYQALITGQSHSIMFISKQNVQLSVNQIITNIYYIKELGINVSHSSIINSHSVKTYGLDRETDRQTFVKREFTKILILFTDVVNWSTYKHTGFMCLRPVCLMFQASPPP